MVRRGIAGSRTEAALAIRSGKVTVAGRPAAKAATLVEEFEPIHLASPARRFVSRGGEKLAAALDRFDLDVTGQQCLDAGASTGGFTDCLLSRGWRLREDRRVTVLERTNVRDLDPAVLPYRPEVVAGDLSFISLALVLRALAAVAADRATFVLLVKPQFEAGRGEVGAGGVVRDPGAWRRSVDRVTLAATETGLGVVDAMASPLLGPAGNVEFFLLATRGGRVARPNASVHARIDAAIDEAIRLVQSTAVSAHG